MSIETFALRYAPVVLSVLRIVAALLFLEHGTSRLFGWPSPIPTPGFMSMYWFAGAIELVGVLAGVEGAHAETLLAQPIEHAGPDTNHVDDGVATAVRFEHTGDVARGCHRIGMHEPVKPGDDRPISESQHGLVAATAGRIDTDGGQLLQLADLVLPLAPSLVRGDRVGARRKMLVP